MNIRLVKQAFTQPNDQQWRCSPGLKDEQKEEEREIL
jgi:hypothetical protein